MKLALVLFVLACSQPSEMEQPSTGHARPVPGDAASPQSDDSLPPGCEYIYDSQGHPGLILCNGWGFYPYRGDPAPDKGDPRP